MRYRLRRACGFPAGRSTARILFVFDKRSVARVTAVCAAGPPPSTPTFCCLQPEGPSALFLSPATWPNSSVQIRQNHGLSPRNVESMVERAIARAQYGVGTRCTISAHQAKGARHVARAEWVPVAP